MGALDELTAKFATSEILDDIEMGFRAKVIILFAVAVSLWGPVYSAVLFSLAGSIGADPTAIVSVLLAETVLIGGSPLLMKYGVPLRTLGHWISINTFIVVNSPAWLGFGSESVWWQAVVVIVAVLLCGVRTGAFWLLASMVNLVVFYRVAASSDLVNTVAFDGTTQLFWQASVMGGLYIVVGLLILAYESLKNWALASIKARQALTEAILRAAPDAIITLQADGRVDLVNDAAASIFGHRDRQQFDGLGLNVLVPSASAPDAPQTERNEFKDWSQENPWHRHVTEGVREDGSVFPVDISVRAIGEGGALCRRDARYHRAIGRPTHAGGSPGRGAQGEPGQKQLFGQYEP